MKRNLFDTVNQIHSEELKTIKKDINEVNQDMYKWQRGQNEPVNFDVFVIGKQRKQEEQEARD